MKVRSILFSTLCMLALTAAFTSCSDDDNEYDPNKGTTVELPTPRAFILNQGSQGNNNAGITFYAPNKNAKDSKNNLLPYIYLKQNEQKLGDTGQDILEYEGNIYVIVSGSKVLLKLNSAAVEEARLSFSEADGMPRYMTAEDGKIYVTLWSHKVARIDARTMKIEAYLDVNKHPEEITEMDGKLYVANSGYGSGNTVSVIDVKTFKKIKDIQVMTNPNNILEANDEIYVISWGDWTNVLGAGYTFQRIKADDSYENIAVVSKFAEHNDIIYLLYSSWDTSVVNTFFSYNTKTHTLSETPFLKNIPEALTKSTIFAFNINEETGEFYLTTTDYTSNGDVYRFKADGTFMETFDSGGINPAKVIFL